MSLRKCPDCGNDVSSSAPSCPHCGRPLRKSSPPIELSGVLIIAVVCAGVLIWRLSAQYQGSSEPPQAVAPETTIAQPTRTGAGLTAKIGYNKKLLLLRVENGDPFAWSNCELSLDAQGVSSGYMHTLDTINPGLTDAALIGLGEFIDGEGRKFDPATQQVATLDIACETPQGQRSYGGRF
jgi:zinc-ribbon domain